MSKREAYIERLEAQLKEWSAKIDELIEKGDKATADAKVKYNKQIELLRDKVNAANKQITELRGSGEEAWEELKSGAERSFKELRGAFERAVSKFK